jgi:hypothetical protein
MRCGMHRRDPLPWRRSIDSIRVQQAHLRPFARRGALLEDASLQPSRLKDLFVLDWGQSPNSGCHDLDAARQRRCATSVSDSVGQVEPVSDRYYHSGRIEGNITFRNWQAPRAPSKIRGTISALHCVCIRCLSTWARRTRRHEGPFRVGAWLALVNLREHQSVSSTRAVTAVYSASWNRFP